VAFSLFWRFFFTASSAIRHTIARYAQKGISLVALSEKRMMSSTIQNITADVL
jgi:hypothetical protein